ncbi:MAG: hypothetical protein ACREX4_18725 [Gammaproteobacteria bacterium]
MHAHLLRLGTLLFITVFLTCDPALADPPDWAPAHGYRAKHGYGHKGKHHKDDHRQYRDHDGDRDYDHGYAGDYDDDDSEDDYDEDDRGTYYPERRTRRIVREDRYPHAARDCTRRVSGQETGAALGGALGAQMGSGNPAAQVTGAVLGAVLGSQIDGAIVPQQDADCMRQALEEVQDDESVRWADAGSSTEYEIVPRRTFERGGRRCRDVVTTVLSNGRLRKAEQTACRSPDGRWRVMN